MAGRGTDIILGGNSDYMARLKLREVLLPRLVKPEDGHNLPFRFSECGSGFSDAPPLSRLGTARACIPASSRMTPIKPWSVGS